MDRTVESATPHPCTPCGVHASSAAPEQKKRNYTPTPPLPPPPAGLAVMTREEAGAFFGVSLGTWGQWEKDGRIIIPRYRAPFTPGNGRPIYYAVDDLARLREEFRKLEEPHPHPELPGVIRVPIRSRLHTMHALIDAEDLPKVQGKHWNWSPASDGRGGEVVLATMGQQTPLKRVILGLEHAGRDTNIVYANGDPLDCRRANLVVRTNSEKNLARRRAESRGGRPCTSRFKGVHWDGTRRLWLAQIGKGEEHRYLGRFGDEVEAALAYDQAARELFGAHAGLNFPDGPETAPPRTGLDPWGKPVRAKNKYRLTPPLPPPPEGARVMTREEAAPMFGVSATTFHLWEAGGRIAIPRYRLKPVTGTLILYSVADLERLRDEFAKEGQPYADPQDAGTWRVPIWTKKGFIEALIDATDLQIVRGKCWNFVRRKDVAGEEHGVVVRSGEDDVRHTPLPRLIMGVQDDGLGVNVAHENGNPLDCRRANLVIRTAAQRTARVYKHSHRCGEPCTSIYKGVYWNERLGKWVAQIGVDNRPRRLGVFESERDAALAYDEAARDLFGADARVNFPEEGELPTALRSATPTSTAPQSSTTIIPAKPLAA